MKLITQVIVASCFIIFTNISEAKSNPGDCKHTAEKQRKFNPPKFNRLDENTDGKVSLDEFKKHQLPRGKHNKVFAHIDTNNDGFISSVELKNHRRINHQRNKH